MFKRNLPAALTLAAAMLFVCLSATAQPLADRVPDDAVIYVGWAGADSMGPGYDGSHLKAMLEASELPRVVNEVVPKLFARLADREPQAAEVAEFVNNVLRPAWRHPTA